MHLNVKIQDHSFKLNVGSGNNDWTWLSHYAARRFSKISYPQGTYLPAQLYLIDKQNQSVYPHPREKIRTCLQDNKLSHENVTAIVKIRKGNHVFTNYEKLWQSEAYGLERMMMNVTYVVDTEKYRNKQGEKEFYFKFVFNYKMHTDIRHFFNQKKYGSPVEIQLEEIRYNSQTSKVTTFKGQIKLPFGQVHNPELVYYFKDPKDPSSFRSQRIKDIELKPDLFKVSLMISPKYISIQQQNSLAAQQMRISENITKNLQQKQLETNKRNISLSMCCYGFEQFWKLLESNHGYQLKLEGYDVSTRERLKIILQKSLNDLYKIFFYYFTIQNQTKEKKEDLAVAYQNVMHFLRFYEVFKSFKRVDRPEKGKIQERQIETSREEELRLLDEFLDLYNNLRPTTLKDTVNVEEKGIKFVQFVSILLRAISFKQTQLPTNKGQTFDVSVASVIDHIIQIQSEQDLFSAFKQNIRKNPTMIEFLRLSSAPLKQIFMREIERSVHKSEERYLFMKQEFKMMLETSGLTGENTDKIIDCMFGQLDLPEEGLYYYEFVEAIQWLAMALVESSKDDAVFGTEDEETSLVIQKIKYLLDKVLKKQD